MMTSNAISTSHPIDFLGLINSLGLAAGTEMNFLSQLVTSVWGVVMTGKVMPMMSPLLMTYMIMPLLKVIKSIAKTFILIGITGWLFAAMLPIFLASIGMSGAGVFVGRALQSSNFPYKDVDVTGFSNLTFKGLEYLELDSPSCKRMLSCKAGEFINYNYPFIGGVFRQTGLGDFMESYAKRGQDELALETLSVLLGRKNGTCDEELDPCLAVVRFESVFDASKKEILRNLTESMTTTPMPVVEEPILPLTNDFVVNAIKKAAGAAGANNSFLLNLLS